LQSRLTYHVSHPLHQVDGVSHAARGKGVCHAGQCDFLIAVPVKSFDSGDSNRDLHMLQVTRGGEFPMVIVRTSLPEDASESTTIQADLEVQFAGQTAKYKQVPFEQTKQGNEDNWHHPGHVVGFQDRPAVSFNDRREERNTGPSGIDLAKRELKSGPAGYVAAHRVIGKVLSAMKG